MSNGHRSEIFAISDDYVEKRASFSPIDCTQLGIRGYDDKLDDFSLVHMRVKPLHTLARFFIRLRLYSRSMISIELRKQYWSSVLHDSREAYVVYGQLESPVSFIRQVFSLKHQMTSPTLSSGWTQLVKRDCIEEVHAEGHRTARYLLWQNN